MQQILWQLWRLALWWRSFFELWWKCDNRLKMHSANLLSHSWPIAFSLAWRTSSQTHSENEPLSNCCWWNEIWNQIAVWLANSFWQCNSNKQNLHSLLAFLWQHNTRFKGSATKKCFKTCKNWLTKSFDRFGRITHQHSSAPWVQCLLQWFWRQDLEAQHLNLKAREKIWFKVKLSDVLTL